MAEKHDVLIIGAGLSGLATAGYLAKAGKKVKIVEKLPVVAELAVGDACTGTNPRAIDPKTMEKLLACCFYGTEVDF